MCSPKCIKVWDREISILCPKFKTKNIFNQFQNYKSEAYANAIQESRIHLFRLITKVLKEKEHINTSPPSLEQVLYVTDFHSTITSPTHYSTIHKTPYCSRDSNHNWSNIYTFCCITTNHIRQLCL